MKLRLHASPPFSLFVAGRELTVKLCATKGVVEDLTAVPVVVRRRFRIEAVDEADAGDDRVSLVEMTRDRRYVSLETWDSEDEAMAAWTHGFQASDPGQAPLSRGGVVVAAILEQNLGSPAT